MPVQVTIRPHVVVDTNGRRVEFDQFQILVGQRVMGYLGKKPGCTPKLVARDVPEDLLRAIHAAAEQVLGMAEPAVVSQPIGEGPAPDQPPPPTVPADDADLEASLGTDG